ncbi:putative inhibitor of Bruton tyrosine kinase [Apostichopus japonicus]|uniref:Putative inhibitor of Bruton tyrosine kinase n=1 Tax=Stichopus japonicus TaxID=307972 RepID=A0A2G8KYF1_STIJA|nr:putative inhibitor of Bruton tyrosine kinase [Apostichopus japonicus]
MIYLNDFCVHGQHISGASSSYIIMHYAMYLKNCVTADANKLDPTIPNPAPTMKIFSRTFEETLGNFCRDEALIIGVDVVLVMVQIHPLLSLRRNYSFVKWQQLPFLSIKLPLPQNSFHSYSSETLLTNSGTGSLEWLSRRGGEGSSSWRYLSALISATPSNMLMTSLPCVDNPCDVYTWGSNSNFTLGHSNQQSRLSPDVVDEFLRVKVHIKQVAVNKYHTVVLAVNGRVFTCGHGQGGRLGQGHAKSNQFISVPKLVTTLNHKNMEICHIASSDGVTACSTSNGDIYLLQNFVCRKIVNKQLNIAKIVVCGGTLDTGLEEIEVQGKSKAPVVMVILHKSGKVLSWQSSDETLRRCVSNRKRQIFFSDVTLSKQGLLLATTEGEAFKGHFTQKKTAPVFCLTEIPEVGPCKMETNLKMLLSEVSCADSIHDIEIKVGLQVYPAHRFILASRSDYFKRQLMGGDSQSTKEDVLTLEEEVHLNRNVTTMDMTTAVNSDTLKRILTYLYTNSCDVFDWNFVENVLNSERVKFGTRQPTIKENQPPKSSKGGKKKKKDKSTKEKNATETLDPDQQAVTLVVRQIKDAAKMFGITSLFQRLELVKMRDSRLDNFRPDTGKLSFDRFEFAELSDVILESDDEVLHHCHRCILVSRVEYFNSMLASSWFESSSTAPLQLPIPSSVMSILLDFVYTSTTPTLDGCTDMELVCNVLVTADQLLLPRLKEMTETVLVDMISLRNVSQLLEFATIYQAPQLKSSCQQFIGLNIVYLLESQSLDSLSDDVMVELTKAYREMIPGLSRRIITPYSKAPSSDDVLLLMEEVSEIDEVISRAKSRRKERRRSSERFSQSSESEVIHLSESIDEDKVSKTQTASSAEMRKVISTAKARRKERRRSSEKRNSERHSFVEEVSKDPR